MTEDSRCPVDVTCVWEGNARLVMTGVVAGEERPFELNTAYNPVAGPREATVDGYLIELTGLDPHPRVGQSIPPARYRATLRVTHATTAAAAAL